MNIPAELKYTKEHEWIRLEDGIATIGITEYAQGELGDVVFVELPSVGTSVRQMANFGTIEAVKAVSDLYSPVSGKVIEINKALESDPMVINRDPYGEGWMIRVQVEAKEQLEQLLSADSYKGIIG